MKTFIFSICMVTICQIVLAQQSYMDKRSNQQLWGKIAVQDLKEEPYIAWYEKSANTYEARLQDKDKELFKDINVKIFLGTWCGDTKYLLPRFIKSWESMGLDLEKVEFIAVHNAEENYKQGPSGETVGKNIHKVPTIIFEKGATEIGRIVERSVFDLETDMVQIVSNNVYEERYQAVKILDQFFSETSKDSLSLASNLNLCAKKLRRELTSVYDLSSYGYVLLAQNEMEQAEFTFKLNKKLFPYNPVVYEGIGDYKKKKGDLRGAMQSYYEVLRIKKEDDYALKQLSEMQLLLESTTLKS